MARWEFILSLVGRVAIETKTVESQVDTAMRKYEIGNLPADKWKLGDHPYPTKMRSIVLLSGKSLKAHLERKEPIKFG